MPLAEVASVPLQRFVFISFNFVVAVLLLNLVVASFLEYQVRQSRRRCGEQGGAQSRRRCGEQGESQSRRRCGKQGGSQSRRRCGRQGAPSTQALSAHTTGT